MTRPPCPRARLQRCILLAGGLLLAAAGLAQAAPAPLTRQQVEVRRGDTLDRVIRRSLPELGLKPELVRATFIALNPQAFPGGRAHRLLAGTRLTVPDRDDLRQHALQHYPALIGLLQAEDPAPKHGVDRSEEIRLRWIRYP